MRRALAARIEMIATTARHQHASRRRKFLRGAGLSVLVVVCRGCAARAPPADRVRVSGQVEATDVQVASPVGGRLLELNAAEGQRVEAGAVVARLDTADAELALARARAERDQADAQLRLLRAGARPEDIRQAEAQVATAARRCRRGRRRARGRRNRRRSVRGAPRVELRLPQAARRCGGAARRRAGTGAERPTNGSGPPARTLARLRAGARREEIDAARARVAAADGADRDSGRRRSPMPPSTAPIARHRHRDDRATSASWSSRARRLVIDHRSRSTPWANVYVDEPVVPRLRLGQAATLFTDAGSQASRHRQLHLARGRVHAAQRADRRRPLEARLPREDHRSTTQAAC